MLKGLAATMAPDMQGALSALLPPGGDSVLVPLSYASSTKTTMWVDKLTGTTVDADSRQTVTAQMKSKLGTVPLAAVLDVDTKMSPTGIADAVKQSKDDQSRLLWEGAVAPGALAVLAVAFLVGAVVVGRRGRAVESAAGAAEGSAGGGGGGGDGGGDADGAPESPKPAGDDE